MNPPQLPLDSRPISTTGKEKQDRTSGSDPKGSFFNHDPQDVVTFLSVKLNLIEMICNPLLLDDHESLENSFSKDIYNTQLIKSIAKNSRYLSIELQEKKKIEFTR